MHPPSSLPDDIPAMQVLAAHATHWGLYALLIVQPFAGWIATSAYRAPVTVFGWFELPPIWPENRTFSGQLFSVHRLIGIAIAGLVAAHIGAALYHHFVRKDRILMRIVTGSWFGAGRQTNWPDGRHSLIRRSGAKQLEDVFESAPRMSESGQ
jgi:cytochrome b561